MVRWTLVSLCCLAALGCATFRQGASRGLAESVERGAQEVGDPTLVGYAREVGDRPDNFAAYTTAMCLADLLAGLRAEAALARAPDAERKNATRAVVDAARNCAQDCAQLSTDSLAQQQAGDVERKVVADVAGRCTARWGAKQEKANALALRGQLHALEELAAKRSYLALSEALEAFVGEEDAQRRAGTLGEEDARQMTAAIAAIREAHADGLGRARAYREDPAVVEVERRRRLVRDRRTLALGVIARAERCTATASDPERCREEAARYRVARSQMEELDREERELLALLAERRRAAGL